MLSTVVGLAVGAGGRLGCWWEVTKNNKNTTVWFFCVLQPTFRSWCLIRSAQQRRRLRWRASSPRSVLIETNESCWKTFVSDVAVNHWFCIFWAYRFPVGQLHPRRAVWPFRKIQRQVPYHRKRAHTSHLLQPDVSDVHWTRGEYGRVKWLLSTVQKRFLTFVSLILIFNQSAFAAIWGLKQLREYSSTSSVFWNSTRENCHSLLLR